MVEGVPEGYRTLQPFLLVPDIDAQMDFLVRAFGGEVVERVTRPSGQVMHGEVRIGDSLVMLGPACRGDPPRSWLYLYVPDVDATHAAALAAGATPKEEPADQFYGDRVGAVLDASGNTWWIATRIESLSPEELARRISAGPE